MKTTVKIEKDDNSDLYQVTLCMDNEIGGKLHATLMVTEARAKEIGEQFPDTPSDPLTHEQRVIVLGRIELFKVKVKNFTKTPFMSDQIPLYNNQIELLEDVLKQDTQSSLRAYTERSVYNTFYELGNFKLT